MDLLSPPGDDGVIGDASLTSAELQRRLERGARFVHTAGRATGATAAAAELPLFVVTASRAVRVVAAGEAPRARPGDTVIVLTGPR
jgi:hypothetical protein